VKEREFFFPAGIQPAFDEDDVQDLITWYEEHVASGKNDDLTDEEEEEEEEEEEGENDADADFAAQTAARLARLEASQQRMEGNQERILLALEHLGALADSGGGGGGGVLARRRRDSTAGAALPRRPGGASVGGEDDGFEAQAEPVLPLGRRR
jgi:hypothetical protein